MHLYNIYINFFRSCILRQHTFTISVFTLTEELYSQTYRPYFQHKLLIYQALILHLSFLKDYPSELSFRYIHLPSHPNTSIHNTTQNITLSLSGDQTLLGLNSLMGFPNHSMAILGLCAITIPIFSRGIFGQKHPLPTLEFTRQAFDQFHSILTLDMQGRPS